MAHYFLSQSHVEIRVLVLIMTARRVIYLTVRLLTLQSGGVSALPFELSSLEYAQAAPFDWDSNPTESRLARIFSASVFSSIARRACYITGYIYNSLML